VKVVDCSVCGSSHTEELTGEELDFVGRRTVWDEERGYTYRECHNCGVMVHAWTGHVVSWDLSQMDETIEKMRVGESGGSP